MKYPGANGPIRLLIRGAGASLRGTTGSLRGGTATLPTRKGSGTTSRDQTETLTTINLTTDDEHSVEIDECQLKMRRHRRRETHARYLAQIIVTTQTGRPGKARQGSSKIYVPYASVFLTNEVT